VNDGVRARVAHHAHLDGPLAESVARADGL
jgi:hypothetical protein